jgi:hypothetical protein
LSADRFTAFPKAHLPESVICCFLFQVPVTSYFLKVTQ